MKVSTCKPDALSPGTRRLLYGGFCWFNRHTTVLRGIGALLRHWPSIAGRLGLAARACAAKHVLTRPHSFSNTSHAPNLVSGDYLIAMDPGPTYAADKALLKQRLVGLNVQADADRETQRLVDELRQRREKASFDLIDDYLLWVVHRAIEPVFGTAASKVAAGAQGGVGDLGLQRQYLLEIRYVAGQLLAGKISTLDIQRRAEVCADALQARIKDVIGDIRRAWGIPASSPSEAIERNAVGLAWISHPVTVQSGALAVQELLSRPKVYRALRLRAKEIGEPKVWNDCDFRKSVRDHVLELMRFRPIFPLLARDVPRDTEFETGGSHNAKCPGGGGVTVLSIAALFDPHAVPDSGQFCPHRDWRDEKDLRWLMFGYGDRQCPAKVYAVEILTSALIGLLTLPELRLARGEGKAIVYDGPLMTRMRVRFA
jgi:hypothetical protein